MNSKIIEFKILKPIQISYEPKEDITTFEIAQCIPVLFLMNHGGFSITSNMIDQDAEYMRHFNVVDPN